MSEDKLYLKIISHYEKCLERYGDSHRGVDWPNAVDAQTRYRVMLEVIQKSPETRVSLLDFGCGASHLYEYILRERLNYIVYSGADLSEKYISLCQQKFPHVAYYCFDLLEDDRVLPEFDYIVLNGVLTEKRELTFEQMWDYCQLLLKKIFAKARKGIAFNIMSKHVDWERDDLFHLPFDVPAAFLKAHLSRHFIFRQDYGLHEYTAYVYRQAQVIGEEIWPKS